MVSIGVFFVIIDPEYKKVQEYNATIAENEKMIVLADQLRSEREKLQSKYNDIGEKDIASLQKVLPDTVDNVRLILDINNIAESFGISITNIGVDGDTNSGSENKNDSRVIKDSVGSEYGTISLSFSVTASYENFKGFMRRLEDSLRLVDVTEFSVNATNGSDDIYQYSVKLDTYWLR